MQSDLARFGSVRTSYSKIHESVKIGLQECGLDPKFYSSKDVLPKGNDCFDFPVESDLSRNGKKIAGGAQKRSEGVLLHHESILIPPDVQEGDLIAGIKQGLEAVFGLSIQKADLDPGIYFQAEKLIKNVELKTEGLRQK
jgi:lipoate-protein ligase A